MSGQSRRRFLAGTAAAIAGGTAAVSNASAHEAKGYDYLTPVFTTSDLSVRTGPGTDYGRKAIADKRTGGRVFEGPEWNDGYYWWKVQFSGDYDNGPVTGWVAENWLSRANFICPLTGTVTSTYWDLRDGGSRYHRAVDISTSPSGGGLVVAARAGTVRIPPYDYGGYGNWIILEHDNGWETWYGHLRDFRCSAGERVQRGEVIAIEGSTGVGGAHLDFSVHSPSGAKLRSYYDEGESTVAGTGVPRAFF